MASVNFEKIKKGSKPVSAYIKHNDADERKIHSHANKDIDISISDQNRQWADLTYEETNRKFRERIEFLDSTTNTNNRKDRVECYSLYVPIPAAVRDKETFFQDLCNLCADRFGKDNLINAYLHVDEVHDYVEDGVVKTSLEHAHILVVPEIDGKLNGKMFSGKEAMRSFNKTVDSMCNDKYHCKFNTGEPYKNKTVEELKAESEKEKELLRDLSDKSGIVPKSKGINSVTISKKDYGKLVNKASAYDKISQDRQDGMEQLQADKLQFQQDFEDSAAYRLNKKKLDARLLEEKEAEMQLKEEIESSGKALSELIGLKRSVSENYEQVQADYDDYLGRIESAKDWAREHEESIKGQVEFMQLKEENKKLKKQYEGLNVVIKAIVTVINKLDEFISQNPDIVPEFIRDAIRELKEIVDEKVEPEHEKQFRER